MGGDTLAERYESTIVRLEEISRAGCQVEVVWECEFDEGILAHHPELATHPLVVQSTEYSRCFIRGTN
jgi:G:T-mismatch repair DNA endonuclease (very short patch repair protein)